MNISKLLFLAPIVAPAATILATATSQTQWQICPPEQVCFIQSVIDQQANPGQANAGTYYVGPGGYGSSAAGASAGDTALSANASASWNPDLLNPAERFVSTGASGTAMLSDTILAPSEGVAFLRVTTSISGSRLDNGFGYFQWAIGGLQFSRGDDQGSTSHSYVTVVPMGPNGVEISAKVIAGAGSHGFQDWDSLYVHLGFSYEFLGANGQPIVTQGQPGVTVHNPEPMSIALVAIGASFLVVMRRRRVR